MVLTTSLGNVYSLRCARSPASLCAIGERTSDRKRLIFTAFDPIQGRGRKLAQFDTKPTTDAGHAWDLSPDGTRIAIVQRSDSTIHLLSLGGRAPAEVVVKGWSSFQALAGLDGRGEGSIRLEHDKERIGGFAGGPRGQRSPPLGAKGKYPERQLAFYWRTFGTLGCTFAGRAPPGALSVEL
jgi:hypothetical protein